MKSIFLLLVVVSTAFTTASAFEQCGMKGSASRILNGVDAGPGEFPWQVSIQFGDDGHVCGGSLIGNQHVLTAAHCLDHTKGMPERIAPFFYRVIIGNWHMKRRDGTETEAEISEFHVHEKYNVPEYSSNDIAVLKLKKPVRLNGPYVGIPCLPPAGKDYRGAKGCSLSGWGLIDRFPQTWADTLQKVTGRIWGSEELKKEYKYFGLPDNVVGFGDPEKWSACFGDSGGPLVCPNGKGTFDLVGVVSHGPFNCKGKPAVFTEVAAFRSWISEKTSLLIYTI